MGTCTKPLWSCGNLSLWWQYFRVLGGSLVSVVVLYPRCGAHLLTWSSRSLGLKTVQSGLMHWLWPWLCHSHENNRHNTHSSSVMLGWCDLLRCVYILIKSRMGAQRVVRRQEWLLKKEKACIKAYFLSIKRVAVSWLYFWRNGVSYFPHNYVLMGCVTQGDGGKSIILRKWRLTRWSKFIWPHDLFITYWLNLLGRFIEYNLVWEAGVLLSLFSL